MNRRYGGSNLMTGDLSFMSSAPNVVGQNIQLLDNVGTSLTESYYRNRQAVSKMKSDILALPDVNNENNRKILEGLSKEVSDTFSQYAKEGTWFDADNAVYDMMDKLQSDTRVKDLIKDAGLAAQTDKVIEDSKATELDKQTRRAMNAQMYKGIRNEKGERTAYNGRGLSGDLDITKYFKKYNELVAGWKADATSMAMNPGSFKMESALPGTQAIYNKFGTIDIEKVDKDEVERYLMGMVQQDNHLKAELNDISELTLFRNTGKLTADRDAVMQELTAREKYMPALESQRIISSDEFKNATEGKSAVDVQKYYSKVMSDPTLREQYFNSGSAKYAKELDHVAITNPGVYDQVYKSLGFADFSTNISNIADKAAYTKEKLHQQIVADPFNDEYAKQLSKSLGKSALMTDVGGMNIEGIGRFMNLKNTAESKLFEINAMINSGQLTGSSLDQANKQKVDLETTLNTNNFILDTYKQGAGVTDLELMTTHESDFKSIIKQFATSFNYATKAGQPRIGIKNQDIDTVYNILKNNVKASPEELSTLAGRQGITISPTQMNVIKSDINSKMGNVLQETLTSKGVDQVSVPIYAVGSVGAEPFAYQNTTKYLADKFAMGGGDFVFITHPDKDKVGQTNQGQLAFWDKITGENTIPTKDELLIEPAYVKDANGTNTGKQYFAVTDTRTKQRMLVRYDGSDIIGKDINSELFINAALRRNDVNDFNKGKNVEMMRSIAGIEGGSVPVTTVGGQKMEGMSLSRALDYAKDKPEIPPMEISFGDTPFRIETIREKGSDGKPTGMFIQKMINVHTGRELFKPVKSNTPNGITQYVGANQQLLGRLNDPRFTQSVIEEFGFANDSNR